MIITEGSSNRLLVLLDTIHNRTNQCGIIDIKINSMNNLNSVLGFESIVVEQPKFNKYLREKVLKHPKWNILGHGKPHYTVFDNTHSIYEIFRQVGIKPVKFTRSKDSIKKDNKDFLLATRYYFNVKYFYKNMYRLFSSFRLPCNDKVYLHSIISQQLYNKSITNNITYEENKDNIDELQCIQALNELCARGSSVANLCSNDLFILKEQLKEFNMSIDNIQINMMYTISLDTFMNCLLCLEDKKIVYSHLIHFRHINLNQKKRIATLYNVISFLTKNNNCSISISNNPMENSPIFGWHKIIFSNPYPFILICKIMVLMDYNNIWLKPNGKKDCKNPSWCIYNTFRQYKIRPHYNIKNNNSDLLYYNEWIYQS